MAHTLKNIWNKVKAPDSPPPSEPLPPSQDQIEIPTFPAYDPVISEIYRHRRHIGVNLGSMFILEKWLCPPALCSWIISKPWESELDFLHASSSPLEAREALEEHWRTYITEADFEWMQSIGINAVRIPIGYWVAGQEYMIGDFKRFQGVYDSAWARLLTVIDMAGRHNIGVLIDLHGAPGGQNGDTHCGVSTHKAELLNSNYYMDTALQVLTRLAKELAPINHVIGLQVLNEPIDHPHLVSFYEKAYQAIRSVHPDIMLPIYIGDAWNIQKYSAWLAKSDMKFVVIDTHQYFCHMPADHAKSVEQHIKDVQTNISSQLQFSANNVTGNVIVGEWSVVLNGKSIEKSKRHDAEAMKSFGQVQQRVFDENCAGWFYWNYRTNDDGWYWSFRYCVRNSVMPPHYNLGQLTPEVAQMVQHQAKAERDKRLEDTFIQHTNYWSNNGLPNSPDFWRFQEGFQAGYTVALRFLAAGQGSRIGFRRQLTIEYSDDHLRRHHGSTKSVVWHFEHGFVQGLEAVEQIIQQTITQ
ncbi:glycoside hydrolase superfamily [Umbelopsis sp. PMI_123]|nr:glycoside hydrolase superfamily [Umbelopsis sp. PMI_123]